MEKYKRIVFYISDEDYRRLKAKIALLGLSMSEWFRTIIKDFLNK